MNDPSPGDNAGYTLSGFPRLATLANVAASGGVWLPMAYVDISGSHTSAVMLAQIVYWTPRATIERLGETWIAKPYSEWWEECRLSERTARRALERLEERGLVKSTVFKFGGAPTLHVRLVYEGMESALRGLTPTPPPPPDPVPATLSGTGSGSGQSGRNVPDKVAGTLDPDKVAGTIYRDHYRDHETENPPCSPPSEPNDPASKAEPSPARLPFAVTEGAREPSASLEHPNSAVGLNARAVGNARGVAAARANALPEVVELCDLLAERVGERWGNAPKVTAQWYPAMDLLLRRGCPEWATPAPVPAEKVRRMIEFIFADDTDDFWAKNIRSAPTLRQKWEKLKIWANDELARRRKPGVPQVDTSWMSRAVEDPMAFIDAATAEAARA